MNYYKQKVMISLSTGYSTSDNICYVVPSSYQQVLTLGNLRYSLGQCSAYMNFSVNLLSILKNLSTCLSTGPFFYKYPTLQKSSSFFYKYRVFQETGPICNISSKKEKLWRKVRIRSKLWSKNEDIGQVLSEICAFQQGQFKNNFCNRPFKNQLLKTNLKNMTFEKQYLK